DPDLGQPARARHAALRLHDRRGRRRRARLSALAPRRTHRTTLTAVDIEWDAMPDSDRTQRAEALLDKIFTPAWRQHEGGVAWPTAAGLDFARICVEHCYADAWAREGALDLKTRSLVTLTALAA